MKSTNLLRIILPGLFFFLTLNMQSVAQEIPLVYNIENTGIDCPEPPLPEYDDITREIDPLTDPFEWSDGSARISDFEDWTCRRAEIKAEIEKYEIGEKPGKPDTLIATLQGDTLLIVDIIVNDDTLTLTSRLTIPESDGPYPVLIGMGFGGSGSIPSDIFTSRNIAFAPFNYGEVMAHTQTRGSEPINRLYPELEYMGAYSAWSWGVSRLIDGLELIADSVSFDLDHIGVTGCSFAGKMALFAGAFDERIALTIAQESGGGGAASWRVSNTILNVENLSATSKAWFITDMWDFAYSVNKLPHDHHELMAMVFPRALLVLGNPDMVWLADESGYISCRAAHEVWKAFGVGDRFGFSILGEHGHCALPEVQRPEVEAFVDKFMLGIEDVNTNVTISEYDDTDYLRWIEWWETGDPSFPERLAGDNEFHFYEAECGEVGANWVTEYTRSASNDHYVKSNDLSSTSEAPSSPDDHLTINFSVEKTGKYYIFANLKCPNYEQDSYWMKIDDGEFRSYDRLKTISYFVTNGWEWVRLDSADLEAGEHTLTFAYREQGALLDKIYISDYKYALIAEDQEAENICTIAGIKANTVSTVQLESCYPNPSNGITTITFRNPYSTYVSLKIYSVVGSEIAELAGKEFPSGTHTIEFNSGQLSNGVYFYTLETAGIRESRKMIVQN